MAHGTTNALGLPSRRCPGADLSASSSYRCVLRILTFSAAASSSRLESGELASTSAPILEKRQPRAARKPRLKNAQDPALQAGATALSLEFLPMADSAPMAPQLKSWKEPAVLTPAQLLQWEREGFIVSHCLLPAPSIAALKLEVDVLVAGKKLQALQQRQVAEALTHAALGQVADSW